MTIINDGEVVTGEVITTPTRTGGNTSVATIADGVFSPINKLAGKIVNGILEAKKIKSDENLQTLKIETDAKIKTTAMEYAKELYDKLTKLDNRRLTMIEGILADATYSFDEKVVLIEKLAPKTVYNFEFA